MMAWTLTIGRLFGSRIMVHYFLIIWIAIELLIKLGGENPLQSVQLWVGVFAALLVIVTMHEFGHAFAAVQQGGTADAILLWPLGGLAYVDVPMRPASHLWVAVCGPLVNVALAVAFAPLFFWWAGGFTPHLFDIYSFTPFMRDSPELMKTAIDFSLERGFWRLEYLIPDAVYKLNLVLLVFNLAPAYPMDGGRVLQSVLWARTGSYSRSVMSATAVSYVVSGLFIVAGLFWGAGNFLLILIGVFNIISCRQARAMLRQEQDDGLFGYDFSRGYQGLEPAPHPPGPLARWRARRRARREQKRAQQHRAMRARVDALLEKVHREGMSALTNEEREFLRRASRDYPAGGA